MPDPAEHECAPAPVVPVTLRLFAAAREAAGLGTIQLEASDVAGLLDTAVSRLGMAFAQVLPLCRVWVNGVPAEPTQALAAGDEIAVLPPVSGGAGPVEA